jgi:hypothetical protein
MMVQVSQRLLLIVINASCDRNALQRFGHPSIRCLPIDSGKRRNSHTKPRVQKHDMSFFSGHPDFSLKPVAAPKPGRRNGHYHR